MVWYFDANVFVLASVSDDARAEKAKELLSKMVSKGINGVTAALTIDEVVWVLWKKTKDRTLAIQQGKRILEFDNLKIIGIGDIIVKNALNFMKKYSALKPRDAIHLAAALSVSASTIVSDDADFDVALEIKRKALE